VLAAPPVGGGTSNAPGSSSGTAQPNVGGSGTQYYVPIWTDNKGDLGNSVLYQSGTGSKAKIGINTSKPASTLDIKGGSTVRGLFSLPAVNTATSSAGYDSQPMEMTSSAFNSGTGSAVAQNFQWQAEPVNNNTSNASGTLNLLFATGSNKLAETGLNIASNGQITFATGQTFPGTGTITGVTAGSGLSGGGKSGNVTLSVPNSGITNPMLQNSSLTVTAGTDLTGGGAVSLGGSTTLNLDTSKVPQLNTANTFTGNQTVNGNVSATGLVAGAAFNIGSNVFDFGSYSSQNAFSGFAGNTGIVAKANTGIGYHALGADVGDASGGGSANTAVGDGALSVANDTSGTGAQDNTAIGVQALQLNTTGGNNTAAGVVALQDNTTGSNNTAVGVSALKSNTNSTDNTAVGYQALYSNTVPENTAIGSGALYSNVGDSANDGAANTAVGYSALYYTNDTSGQGVNAEGNTASGYFALLLNTTGSFNSANGAWAGDPHDGSYMTGSFNTFMGAYATVGTGSLTNATAIGVAAEVDESNAIVLGGIKGVNGASSNTSVGIGTTAPTNVFTIGRGAGHALADAWDTYSSRRWKTNIRTLHGALSKVERLRGVSYDLKDSGKHEIGVIAEEVGAVVPEVVSYEKNGKDATGVDYGRLTALLIEAAKEQQTLIHKQQQQIRAQQAQMKLQESQIARLSSQVRAIRASLNTNGRTGAEVRTVKAQVPMVRQ